MQLKRRNWSARNFQELNKMLRGVSTGEIAVFDWDNTCICGDVGEALLRRLTFDLAYAMDAKTMAATVPDTIRGVSNVLIQGRPFPLKKMKAAVFSAYDQLKTRPASGARGVVDENYRVFTSGLLALNRALEETPGIGCEFAYPWVNTLLQGLPLSEFDRHAETAIREELRAPLRRRALLDPKRRWRYDWTGGIRLYPEMKELAACWQQRGGVVVVSSASNRQLVEKAIAMTGFPCRRVIGMELAVAGNRFSPTLAENQPPNLGRGKVANLVRLLADEPVLAAGDSDNDYDMLTSFPATRLRLIIDRHHGGKIDRLLCLAASGESGFLAQEIDPRAGKFRADGRSG